MSTKTATFRPAQHTVTPLPRKEGAWLSHLLAGDLPRPEHLAIYEPKYQRPPEEQHFLAGATFNPAFAEEQLNSDQGLDWVGCHVAVHKKSNLLCCGFIKSNYRHMLLCKGALSIAL